MKPIVLIISALILFPLLSIGQKDSLKVFTIGDHYQGGIIFFVDQTGKHGLIASPNDQTTEKVMWGNNGVTYALSPNDGKYNTNKILEYFHDHPKTAAKSAAYLCSCLKIENYSDWYLPAIEELRMMYYKRDVIGNFLLGDYCSSTEYAKNDVYSIHFRPSRRIDYHYNKDNKDYFVRCIRKF